MIRNLASSIRLAETVAGGDGTDLYVEFKRANKLGVFLRAMRESALRLLETSQDEYPWSSRF